MLFECISAEFIVFFIQHHTKPLVIITPDKYKTSIIDGIVAGKIVSNRPLSPVRVPGRYPWLTGIVGSDSKFKTKKLQLHFKSREVPPRSLSVNFIREHGAPRQLHPPMLGILSCLSRVFVFCSNVSLMVALSRPAQSDLSTGPGITPGPSHLTASSTVRTRSGAGSSRSAAPRSSSAR